MARKAWQAGTIRQWSSPMQNIRSICIRMCFWFIGHFCWIWRHCFAQILRLACLALSGIRALQKTAARGLTECTDGSERFTVIWFLKKNTAFFPRYPAAMNMRSCWTGFLWLRSMIFPGVKTCFRDGIFMTAHSLWSFGRQGIRLSCLLWKHRGACMITISCIWNIMKNGARYLNVHTETIIKTGKHRKRKLFFKSLIRKKRCWIFRIRLFTRKRERIIYALPIKRRYIREFGRSAK